MGLSYEDVHWGTPPEWIEQAKALRGRARAHAQLKAITYATVKNGAPALWRHQFDRQNGRYPYLLVPDERGRYEVEAPSAGEELIAIGRVVDLETVGPSATVLPVLYWCATNRAGSHVFLLTRVSPAIAIEARAGGPFVTEDGIVH